MVKIHKPEKPQKTTKKPGLTATKKPSEAKAKKATNNDAVGNGRTANRLSKNTAANIKHKESIPKKLKPSKDRPSKKGEIIRERILDAALDYFGAFGFHGATTRAIADQIGITHTLVLYHFKSKEQLWTATVDHVLKKYDNSIRGNLENSDDKTAKASLRIFIEQFVRLSAEHPQVHRILTTEGGQATERLQWIIDNFIRDHYTRLRDLIRRGQTEGSVRDCDATRLYYLIIAAGGTPFTLSVEYEILTGRDVFSESEILRYIAFIYDIVFI